MDATLAEAVLALTTRTVILGVLVVGLVVFYVVWKKKQG